MLRIMAVAGAALEDLSGRLATLAPVAEAGFGGFGVDGEMSGWSVSKCWKNTSFWVSTYVFSDFVFLYDMYLSIYFLGKRKNSPLISGAYLEVYPTYLSG